MKSIASVMRHQQGGRITPVQTQTTLTEVCLITLQMLYVSKRSLIAHAHWKTWQAYTEILQKDCAVLFVPINPLEGTRVSAEEDAASLRMIRVMCAA